MGGGCVLVARGASVGGRLSLLRLQAMPTRNIQSPKSRGLRRGRCFIRWAFYHSLPAGEDALAAGRTSVRRISDEDLLCNFCFNKHDPLYFRQSSIVQGLSP